MDTMEKEQCPVAFWISQEVNQIFFQTQPLQLPEEFYKGTFFECMYNGVEVLDVLCWAGKPLPETCSLVERLQVLQNAFFSCPSLQSIFQIYDLYLEGQYKELKTKNNKLSCIEWIRSDCPPFATIYHPFRFLTPFTENEFPYHKTCFSLSCNSFPVIRSSPNFYQKILDYLKSQTVLSGCVRARPSSCEKKNH
jgi:hypothetical protein